jgi:hypothetical protein
MANAVVMAPAAHLVAVMGRGGGNANGQDTEGEGGGKDLFHGTVSSGVLTLAEERGRNAPGSPPCRVQVERLTLNAA